MTRRARAYLAAVALRHGGIGYYCLVAPAGLGRQSYAIRVLETPFPLRVWGVVLIAIALAGVVAVAADRARLARAVLVASATVSGWWAAALVAGALVDGVRGLPLAVTWVALTTKDLVVSGFPLRRPDGARRFDP